MNTSLFVSFYFNDRAVAWLVLQELEEFVKTGTAGANRFLTLRENVRAFQQKLHDIIPNQIENVKQQLIIVDKEIRELEGELKKFVFTWSFDIP